MMRHIGGAKRGDSAAGRSRSPDYNMRGDGHTAVTDGSGIASLFYKKCSLSKKQRTNLRNEMLGFLESTRNEEAALVRLNVIC